MHKNLPLHFTLAAMIVAALHALAPTLQGFQGGPNCPVTVPPGEAFTPPAPYPSKPRFAHHFWYGTSDLWTLLQVNGEWKRLPRNDYGFRQKVFWWRPGFDGRTEARPDLRVSGRRIDGRDTFHSEPATNAHSEDFGGWAMLTGVDIPAPGCWELTGVYKAHRLSFVVWVQP